MKYIRATQKNIWYDTSLYKIECVHGKQKLKKVQFSTKNE